MSKKDGSAQPSEVGLAMDAKDDIHIVYSNGKSECAVKLESLLNVAAKASGSGWKHHGLTNARLFRGFRKIMDLLANRIEEELGGSERN